MIADQCLCIDIVRDGGLESRYTKTLQLLHAQEALIAALKAKLQIESARAQTAVQERSALIQTLVTIRQDRAVGMVQVEGKRQEGLLAQERETKARTTGTKVKCWSCSKTGHYGRDSRDNWSRDQGKGKSKKQRQVEQCRKQQLIDRIKFRVVDDSKRTDTVGIRRTSRSIGDRQH